MSFASIGITVACLVVMGTFSLVAYNADALLKTLESQYEILAFVDESCTPAQESALGRKISALPNVKSCRFITREEATASFEEKYAEDSMLQHLDPSIFRDRYAVYVYDLDQVKETDAAIQALPGVGGTRVDAEVAGGFITLRNVAGVISLALIAILLVVSVFIISNTIKLTTFERRDEIAIMKMVGATNSFIRWPFVYEGFLLGIISGVCAFFLQWLLYVSVAKSITLSDTLRLFQTVDFMLIWRPVAAAFGAAGIFVGIGGSLMAIRKFLHV